MNAPSTHFNGQTVLKALLHLDGIQGICDECLQIDMKCSENNQTTKTININPIFWLPGKSLDTSKPTWQRRVLSCVTSRQKIAFCQEMVLICTVFCEKNPEEE